MDFIRTQASTYAGDIDLVFETIFFVTGAWLLAAEGILFYFIWKYRKKKNEKAQYVSGDKHEESKWIHWPHYAVIAFDVVLLFFAIKAWYIVKQDIPKPEETVRIIGHQWAWRFVHPGLDKKLGTEDDVETVDELHIKKGVVYNYKLESEDVLHDFSVPVFRLKQDAVPGRVITGWFEATKTGEFDIQCAEMCGIGHGIMVAKLYIETEEDHIKWLKSAGANTLGEVAPTETKTKLASDQ